MIGSKLCGALLEKIKYDMMVVHHNFEDDMHYSLDHSHAEDLEIKTLDRTVRTRLYFTSESHLHSLLNVLRYPGEGHPSAFSEQGIKFIEDTPELGYLTQIVFRLFESKTDDDDKNNQDNHNNATTTSHKFRVEILFSTGATNDPLVDKSASLKPYFALNSNIQIEDMISYLDTAILAGNEEDDVDDDEGDYSNTNDVNKPLSLGVKGENQPTSHRNHNKSSEDTMNSSSFSTLSTKTTKQSLEQRMLQQQMQMRQQNQQQVVKEECEDQEQQQAAEEEFMNLSMDEPPQFEYMDDDDHPRIFNSGSSLTEQEREKVEREKLADVFQDGAQYLTHPPSSARAGKDDPRAYLDSNTFVAPNTVGGATSHHRKSSKTQYRNSNVTVVSDQWDHSTTNSPEYRKQLLSSPVTTQGDDDVPPVRFNRSHSEPKSAADDIPKQR